MFVFVSMIMKSQFCDKKCIHILGSTVHDDHDSSNHILSHATSTRQVLLPIWGVVLFERKLSNSISTSISLQLHGSI
jgi:hypothetical protein